MVNQQSDILAYQNAVIVTNSLQDVMLGLCEIPFLSSQRLGHYGIYFQTFRISIYRVRRTALFTNLSLETVAVPC